MRFLGRSANLTKSHANLPRLHLCSSVIVKRWLRISTSAFESIDLHPAEASTVTLQDAKFNVTGGPFPLLSVSLSASQDLFTRSGTLVGVAGKVENTVSTLSVLKPFIRTILQIPFLYQRITSTTPVTALISTKNLNTSITVIHMDGTVDWMLAGQSLLAWTGRSLTVAPKANLRMNVAHWGTSEITGRGLLALLGHGSISEIELKAGESYIIHPSNVIAYTINSHRPLPYRLKASSFRFQIPKASRLLLSDIKFLNNLNDSVIWQGFARTLSTFRTWARRTFWGDRLFLQFQGPTTVLLQTRASRIGDTYMASEVDEMANFQPGAARHLVTTGMLVEKGESVDKSTIGKQPAPPQLPSIQRASIGQDGVVSFGPIGDLARSK